MKYLFNLLVFFFIFIISYILLPYFVNGDQFQYNNFYEQIKGLSWIEAFGLNITLLSSYEPGYPTIIWLVANYIDKILFISIINSLFAFFVFKLAIKNGCYPIIAFFVIISNYYFYVCYFSAERLKFSLFFFTIALLLYNYKKLKFNFLIISIFCHVQIIILLICKYLPNLNFKSLKINKFQILLSTVFFTILIIQFIPYLYYKFTVYLFRYFDWEGIIKMMLFVFFSIKYSNSPKKVLLMYLPILLFILLVTGERVTIFGYFIFMFYAIQYKKGLNFGLIFINIYFLIKSLFFVKNIINFGDGF